MIVFKRSIQVLSTIWYLPPVVRDTVNVPPTTWLNDHVLGFFGCRCSRKFWDVTDPSKLGIYTLSVEAALDEDNDELEVELGTCDPRLDDPSLSFSTVTTADPTSSGEAGSSSLQDGEAVSVAAQTEQDMPGLTRIIEQTSTPTNNNHVVRRSPVKTLLGEAMGRFRIPKKTKAVAGTQMMQATPPPSSDPASSSMLHKYLNGEDIHREGLFYVLTGPGGLSRRGPDPQGEGMWSGSLCMGCDRYMVDLCSPSSVHVVSLCVCVGGGGVVVSGDTFYSNKLHSTVVEAHCYIVQ